VRAAVLRAGASAGVHLRVFRQWREWMNEGGFEWWVYNPTSRLAAGRLVYS